jgi:hypothetical protein
MLECNRSSLITFYSECQKGRRFCFALQIKNAVGQYFDWRLGDALLRQFEGHLSLQMMGVDSLKLQFGAEDDRPQAQADAP